MTTVEASDMGSAVADERGDVAHDGGESSQETNGNEERRREDEKSWELFQDKVERSAQGGDALLTNDAQVRQSTARVRSQHGLHTHKSVVVVELLHHRW